MTTKPPVLKIHFLKTGEVRKPRRRKPTYEEIGIKSDLSQFYALKACIERILGHPVYLKIKDHGTIKEWKDTVIRLLKAMELAISSTVVIADQEWRDDISDAFSRGRDQIRDMETSSTLFAALSATLIEIVFLQVGSAPSRSIQEKTAPLSPDYWTLNRYRSVQYVQSEAQRKALKLLVKSKKAGSDVNGMA